ncbi:unnamed protein product [Pleuronectes platessa]|uniref:Uncharacterized protein n=1 Tax=Pleuronectes platessa TaxID=8262 RepID=A0A9N7VID3_PLEPL|nr:unnamed protein product [Pleuronectes platessa]
MSTRCGASDLGNLPVQWDRVAHRAVTFLLLLGDTEALGHIWSADSTVTPYHNTHHFNKYFTPFFPRLHPSQLRLSFLPEPISVTEHNMFITQGVSYAGDPITDFFILKI